MSAAVSPAEQLFADLDTAAIALRLLGAEHPRLKLELIAARVSAHARAVLAGGVEVADIQISPSWGETSTRSGEVGGRSGAGGPPVAGGRRTAPGSAADLPPTSLRDVLPPGGGDLR